MSGDAACVVVVGILAGVGAMAYVLGEWYGRNAGFTSGFNLAQKYAKERNDRWEKAVGNTLENMEELAKE